NGVLTTLFNFHFTDGQWPTTRLIQGNDGSLYGTTAFCGMTNGIFGSIGQGTVFRITTNGVFTSLLLFQGANGSHPFGPLLMGPDGNLYGTTTHEGVGGGGTIFRIVLAATNNNNPPVLTAIPDQIIPVGANLVLATRATDPDSPPQLLTFSLGAGAAANASI